MSHAAKKLFIGLFAFVILGAPVLSVAQSTGSSVTTWGGNNNGQLGRANSPSNLTPALVSLGPNSGIVAVAAGVGHSLALKSDGTVLSWGSNTSGQLGDGTTVSKASPVQVFGLGPNSGVIAIAAGMDFSLALKADGTVLAWGTNGSGQLGDGTTNQRNFPVQVSGLGVNSTVIAISARMGSHSLALKQDGTVVAWGNNNSGQLGEGSLNNHLTPVTVTGLATGSGVIGISAGGSHSLAVKSTGVVVAWGANSSGQLGNGSTTKSSTAVQVSGLVAGSGVTFVVAGSTHSLAMKSDGTVWAWGSNDSGQMGDGTTTQRNTPIQVMGVLPGNAFLTNGVAITAGNGDSFALQADGTVLAWGADSIGQLGDGIIGSKTRAVQVSGLAAGSGVTAIVGGDSHAFAVKSDGSVLSWGANNVGQLGKGTFELPLAVDGLTDFDVVATGPAGSHTLAHKTDGSVWAWGMNVSGQLGDGTTITRSTPAQVTNLGTNSGVTTVAAGTSHSLALKSDGTVMAWGANSSGQLGDGTTVVKMTPVQVMNLGANSGIIAIAAGASHSLALSFDGTLWAWGANGNGQLGDGTFLQRTAPVQVFGFGKGSGIVAIAAGNAHSIAVKSDGTVWAWGTNSFGQLGDGTTVQKSKPAQVLDMSGVGGLTNIASVAAGSFHTLALNSSGSVFVWGSNGNGQLGDGTLSNHNLPVQLTNFSGGGVTKIVGGISHTLALKSSGDVWAWGSNANGQLGDGSLSDRTAPVQTLIQRATTIAAGSVDSVAAVVPPPTDTTPPLITPTVAGTAGNNGWYRSDVTVTWTVTDPESNVTTSNGCTPALINTETNGVTLTCSATNSAGLTGTGSIVIKIDKTAPVVSFTRTAANAQGWNNTSVTVKFTATDSQSGIDGNGLISNTISSEGQNQSTTAMFADLAGNTATATANGINIDMTPPTITTARTAPNANGWNNTAVVVTFNATDNGSGLSGSSSSQQTISTEGKNQSATATFTDIAGNTATSTVDGINIDMTAPVVSFTRTAPNANGWNKTAVVVSFNATDALSGIDGASSTDRTISTEGKNQSASATFTDLAGNTATGTATGINIDMTPPTLQFGAPSPSPNAAGWNNADVRISFTTADNLSGVATTSVPSPLVLTGEGVNISGTVIVTDAAGNFANFVSSSAKIDRTRPVASAVVSPPASNGNVTVTFSGTDSLSGIANCSAPVVLSANGTNQSASGTCTDNAGNVSQPATATGININKVAPTISGLPAPGCSIWPADRKMVQIAAVTATGVAAGSLTVTVTSNETIASSDVVVNNGVVQVRADRDGKGNGRIYTVTARATDSAGNPVVASGNCSVPHDQDRQ